MMVCIESELFYFLNQPFVHCLLHVNVKGINTLILKHVDITLESNVIKKFFLIIYR